jgi:hypothetical protein
MSQLWWRNQTQVMLLLRASEFTHECLAIRVDRKLNSVDRQTPWIIRLQTAGPGGLHSGAGGCATSIRCAARASPEPVYELTFALELTGGQSATALVGHASPRMLAWHIAGSWLVTRAARTL